MDEDLAMADRVAVQFLDLEVVHRQPGVADHERSDRGRGQDRLASCAMSGRDIHVRRDGRSTDTTGAASLATRRG